MGKNRKGTEKDKTMKCSRQQKNMALGKEGIFLEYRQHVISYGDCLVGAIYVFRRMSVFCARMHLNNA